MALLCSFFHSRCDASPLPKKFDLMRDFSCNNGKRHDFQPKTFFFAVLLRVSYGDLRTVNPPPGRMTTMEEELSFGAGGAAKLFLNNFFLFLLKLLLPLARHRHIQKAN